MTLKINEKALEKLVQQQIAATTQKYQHEFDRIASTMKGKPVELILPELQKFVKQLGADVDNAQLKEWAQRLSKGEKLIFTS